MKRTFVAIAAIFSSLSMLAGSDVEFVKGNACIIEEPKISLLKANPICSI